MRTNRPTTIRLHEEGSKSCAPLLSESVVRIHLRLLSAVEHGSQTTRTPTSLYRINKLVSFLNLQCFPPFRNLIKIEFREIEKHIHRAFPLMGMHGAFPLMGKHHDLPPFANLFAMAMWRHSLQYCAARTCANNPERRKTKPCFKAALRRSTPLTCAVTLTVQNL